MADLPRLVGRLRHKLVLRRLAGRKLLRAFAEAYPDAFFVEIGANDGEQHDHLRAHVLHGAWRGILVEPVPYVFDRLARNYAGLDRVALANVAIADRDGTLPFYHLAEAPPGERAELPAWYDALGSFSREAVLGHGRHVPDIERRLVRTEVPCLTFDSLLRRHGADRVDLVAIDTEGHDWEVVKGIDLEAHRPRLLIYEHFHLKPSERATALRHVRDRGYEAMEEGFDTFCLDVRVEDRLTGRFRRLRPAVAGVSVHDEP